jgi:hypothetical protein
MSVMLHFPLILVLYVSQKKQLDVSRLNKSFGFQYDAQRERERERLRLMMGMSNGLKCCHKITHKLADKLETPGPIFSFSSIPLMTDAKDWRKHSRLFFIPYPVLLNLGYRQIVESAVWSE